LISVALVVKTPH